MSDERIYIGQPATAEIVQVAGAGTGNQSPPLEVQLEFGTFLDSTWVDWQCVEDSQRLDAEIDG